MKIYDVSLPIKNGMLVWRGDPEVVIKVTATVEKDGWGESWLSFGSHTGTHVDAPSHFLENGVGIDRIDPQKLIGDCLVLDLTKLRQLEITARDLKEFPINHGSRILFKTGNFKFLKQEVFPKNYISLSLDGAKYLASKEIYLVGIDFLGIEKENNPDHPVHKTLLAAGIINVEGLDLSEVPAGKYQIFCLPLKLVNGDGAPARVFLVKE